MHALIVCRGDAVGSPEGHQIHGFKMYDQELQRNLGLTHDLIQTETLTQIEEAVSTWSCDLAFIMVSWREKPAEVVELFRRLSQNPARPKLIFLDYFAPASSPYLGVLTYVDCYIKRQMYRDRSMIHNDFEGGNLFTDYLSKVLKIDLDGWHFDSKPDPAHVDKMIHGWNLGVTPRYRKLTMLTRLMPLPWERRPFAVNCRLGLPATPPANAEWYYHYRRYCHEALIPLQANYRCTGSGRIGKWSYLAELIFSRVVFSPFGWGEVCFRDYEAIASGALLVKPSMKHLETSPRIYQEGKTYVSVAWDLSDLEEVTRYYLSHPDEAKAIIQNAQTVLSTYFEQGGFVADVRRVLDRAKVWMKAAGVVSKPIDDPFLCKVARIV